MSTCLKDKLKNPVKNQILNETFSRFLTKIYNDY